MQPDATNPNPLTLTEYNPKNPNTANNIDATTPVLILLTTETKNPKDIR